MPSSQSDWDARYRSAAESCLPEPASIVRELLPLLPSGPALDIACGTGRHTLFLAARHQHVTAVDWSGEALDLLEKRARASRIPAHRVNTVEKIGKSPHGGIDLVHADLERLELPESSFELILCLQYLQRSLFTQILRGLRHGGMLLFETFTQSQLEFADGPRNPEHLLEAGELRTAFPGLKVIFYRELRAGQGIASLVARKPGKKS
jgi:tellurite methyltransferase